LNSFASTGPRRVAVDHCDDEGHVIAQNNIVTLRPCAVSSEPLNLVNGAVRGFHYVRVVIVKVDAPNDFALRRHSKEQEQELGGAKAVAYPLLRNDLVL
jgi:hypothetical protein